MSAARRAVGPVLAALLPVLLLAAGWLYSSVREREARLDEERARLAAALDRARSAVDAGLRELVAREDERPFYVYSHYYSPPDVLALTDPVAVSPLAGEAGDPRIVGWLELDPDGTVRTPYSVDPGPATERARRVLDALGEDARATLRAELGTAHAGGLVARTASPVPGSDVGLNAIGNLIASDIVQAQSGDVAAYERVQSRGRAIPRVSRRDVASAMARADVPSTGSVQLPSGLPAAPSLPPLVQGEIEVAYTPMTLRDLDGALVLSRVVSHDGERVLDAVVLDRERIVHTWVPDTIARAVAEDAPTVVAHDASARCASRASASALLPDVELCAPLAPLEARERALDRALALQVAALVLLLVLAGLAVALILRNAARAAELARQKSAFVSAVSHELRTPLTTLRMHAEMLDEGLVTEERRGKVHAELVTESVRLARLVENVLEISRLEEGRRPLRATRADLGARLSDVVESQRGHARGKGFELGLTVPDETLELAFDSAAIEQIVTNAIDNALKYAAKSDEKRIDVALLRARREERAGVEIRVRDRGPGIPEKERERVFERFYRVERPETAHQPGTGLGLALVRELARAHGGEATLEDGAPGAIVVVFLPLA
ncbi:MAG: HAMP domain-containing sensor histidine kinase [Sandaracinus sp.]